MKLKFFSSQSLGLLGVFVLLAAVTLTGFILQKQTQTLQFATVISTCAGLDAQHSACVVNQGCPSGMTPHYTNSPGNNNNGSCGQGTTTATYTCCTVPSSSGWADGSGCGGQPTGGSKYCTSQSSCTTGGGADPNCASGYCCNRSSGGGNANGKNCGPIGAGRCAPDAATCSSVYPGTTSIYKDAGACLSQNNNQPGYQCCNPTSSNGSGGNQCGGCSGGGSCSNNGQFCEVKTGCNGALTVNNIFQCTNNQWVFKYPQNGGSCASSCTGSGKTCSSLGGTCQSTCTASNTLGNASDCNGTTPVCCSSSNGTGGCQAGQSKPYHTCQNNQCTIISSSCGVDNCSGCGGNPPGGSNPCSGLVGGYCNMTHAGFTQDPSHNANYLYICNNGSVDTSLSGQCPNTCTICPANGVPDTCGTCSPQTGGCGTGLTNPYHTCSNGTCTLVNNGTCGKDDCSACPSQGASFTVSPNALNEFNCTLQSDGSYTCSGFTFTNTGSADIWVAGDIQGTFLSFNGAGQLLVAKGKNVSSVTITGIPCVTGNMVFSTSGATDQTVAWSCNKPAGPTCVNAGRNTGNNCFTNGKCCATWEDCVNSGATNPCLPKLCGTGTCHDGSVCQVNIDFSLTCPGLNNCTQDVNACGQWGWSPGLNQNVCCAGGNQIASMSVGFNPSDQTGQNPAITKKTVTYSWYNASTLNTSTLLASKNVLAAKVYRITDTATYSPTSGMFIDPNLNIVTLPPGTYVAIVHIDGFLDTYLTQANGSTVFTFPSSNNLTIKPLVMTPGDIAPAPHGDNSIDIQDYQALVDCMKNINCPNKNIADLNNDGTVDQKDLDILISHFGAQGVSVVTPSFTCVVDPACASSNKTLQVCPLRCSITKSGP